MFEYIKGALVGITPLKAVVEQGGIGYLLFIPLNVFSAGLAIGHQVVFYVSQVIREDSHKLYAFLSREERNLFETLNEVTGVGPKTSLALVGHLGASELESAILGGNLLLLSKVPGIGKKTAERLVIELRDRLKLAERAFSESASPSSSQGIMQDALSALTHLGYPPLQAHKAIKAAMEKNDKELKLPELITTALRNL
jgi:Holliday junction DNA helicase RuvA